ncbi:hypothetical protein ACFV0R_04405 [Streptomyces sp. NPDC059578]|uniref:hypothetical protein n=1 Tax=Streptomyces sp. NPDC059578 TaxID=3346874 RepID=UPI00368D9A6E
MGAGTALRLTHATILVAVCVVVSGLGHALASGVSPSFQGYVVAVPPVSLLAWRLTRRERSAGAVIGASAGAQVMLHALFGLTHGPGGTAHGVHTAHPRPATADGTGLAGSTALALFRSLRGLFDLSSVSSGMASAHVLAGAVCGWWLWRGERALAQLGRALALFLGGLLRFAVAALCGAQVLPVATPAPVERRASDRLPSPLALLRAAPRRGPPPFAS